MHCDNGSNWARPFARILLGIFLLCGAVFPTAANAAEPSPFKDLSGWWSGQGRVGLKDNKAEPIRCRVTYFPSEDKQHLTQNLRCSTQNFKIDVKTELTHDKGKITGKWHEKVYNVGGEINGKAKGNALTLFIKGEEVTANMQLITRDNKQIVEISFQGIDVIGVTMLLKKG